MPKKQQAPTRVFTTVETGLETDTCHRMNLLEILAKAGYSKTLARKLIKDGCVWNPWGWEMKSDKTLWFCWQPAEMDFLVDLTGGEDYWALIIQTRPYYKGWNHSSRVIHLI